MTKRHHATNYHRCERCGQPLVRERKLCEKCTLKQLDAIMSGSLKKRLEAQQACPSCHHSLVDNNHGFDQNDGYMSGDELVHSGSCTYCKVCNPILAAPEPEVFRP